jgi:hypothetical protein
MERTLEEIAKANEQAKEKNMETGGTDMAARYAHIKGWGIDADPENEPTYPMKHWTGVDHQRLNYERPTMQPGDVELLKSNERPTKSAVHGTSAPPQGYSGRIRRYAFKYSEGTYRHWLLLIMADRVNMVEGIVEDIKKGHFPNIVVERGWTAEWKYNRKNFLSNVAAGVAITAGLLLLYSSTRKLRRAL